MRSHTYHFHLDNPIIRLHDVDDLLGKDVKTVIRERKSADAASNLDTINDLLKTQADSAFSRK